MSKIPILSKNNGKRIGNKPNLISSMQLDGEKMILMAEIEILKKEKAAALGRLDAAETVINQLRTQMKALHESKNDGLTKIETLRRSRNKAFTFARKIENGKLKKAEKLVAEKIAILERDSKKKIDEAQQHAAFMATVKIGQAKRDADVRVTEITKQKDKEIKQWKASYNGLNQAVLAQHGIGPIAWKNFCNSVQMKKT